MTYVETTSLGRGVSIPGQSNGVPAELAALQAEVWAARNGYESLDDFLDTLKNETAFTAMWSKTITATAGQSTIDVSDLGLIASTNHIISFLVDGSPQYSSYNLTTETLITMKDGFTFSGGETIFLHWFQGSINLPASHKNSHEAGGYDELDVTKLAGYDENVGSLLTALLDTMTFEAKYPIQSGETDDTPRLNRALAAAAAKAGGVVKLGLGTYNFSSTLVIPALVEFSGSGNDSTCTKLNYTGTGYALVTGGTHLRQRFSNFYLNLNGNSGIRIGDVGANLDRDAGILPRQLGMENVVINGLSTGQYGITIMNASHMNMRDVRSGYGDGGTGLYITNDSYNAGVMSFTDCTFGRTPSSSTNGMDIGLEIDSATGAGLDTYVFTACYFGGRAPIRLGKTVKVRNIHFNGIHIEANHISWGASKVYPVGYIRRPSTPNGHVYKVTAATGAKTSAATEPIWPLTAGGTVTDGDLTWTEIGTDTIYAMEMVKADSVTIKGVSIAGFSSSTFKPRFIKGIAFTDICTAITIMGVDVNEFGGDVYYNTMTAITLTDSLLQKATISGTQSDVQNHFAGAGNFDYAIRLMDSKLKTKNFEGDYFFWTNSLNSKTTFGVAAPTTGSWSKGDVIDNVSPTLVKNIDRWKCITTGSPGTWTANGCGEGTTANRPALVIGDRGYRYFDTDLNKTMYWNGTTWLG